MSSAYKLGTDWALPGAAVTGAYWTETSDEATLQALVANHGAVLTGVAAAGAFSQYKVQSSSELSRDIRSGLRLKTILGVTSWCKASVYFVM